MERVTSTQPLCPETHFDCARYDLADGVDFEPIGLVVSWAGGDQVKASGSALCVCGGLERLDVVTPEAPGLGAVFEVTATHVLGGRHIFDSLRRRRLNAQVVDQALTR